jgi:hypothetical protein
LTIKFQERAENYQPDTLPPVHSEDYLQYMIKYLFDKKGLILIGRKGSGKTHFLLHLFRSLRNQHKIHFSIFNKEKGEFQNLPWEGNTNVEDAQILVLDDLHYGIEHFFRRRMEEEKLIGVLNAVMHHGKRFVLVSDGPLRYYASFLSPHSKLRQLLAEIEENAWQREFEYPYVSNLLKNIGIEATPIAAKCLAEIVSRIPRSLIRVINANNDFFSGYINTQKKLGISEIAQWLEMKLKERGISIPPVLEINPEENQEFYTAVARLPKPVETIEEIRKALSDLVEGASVWRDRIKGMENPQEVLEFIYREGKKLFEKLQNLSFPTRKIIEFALEKSISPERLEEILITAEKLRKLRFRTITYQPIEDVEFINHRWWVERRVRERVWMTLPLITKVLDLAGELYHPYHIKILESGRVVIEEE